MVSFMSERFQAVFPNSNMKKTDFYALIEEIVEADSGTVGGQDVLSDLEGWDSLSVVQFIAVMDKKTGTTPTAAKVVAAKTVADLAMSLGVPLEEG